MSSIARSDQTTRVEEQDFSHGTVTNAVHAEFVSLWLLEYDDRRTIKVIMKGEFFMKLIEDKFNPIHMAICEINGLQWPVAKDSPVIRVGRRSFVFAIPGLLYGLQFSPNSRATVLSDLVMCFEVHACYEDHTERATGTTAFTFPESEDGFWEASRSHIEQITHARLSRFGHYPVSPLMAYPPPAPCFLKLHRLSIATQAVAKSMLEGALLAVHTKVYNLEYNPDGTLVKKAGPTVSVFTDIVEAVEMKKRTPEEYVEFLKEYQSGMFSAGDLRFEVWTLIRNSLRDFVNIVLNVEEDVFGKLRNKEAAGGEGSSNGKNEDN